MSWFTKAASNIIINGNMSVPILISGDKTLETADAAKVKELIQSALQNYYNRIDPQGWRFISARYQFVVDKWSQNYREIEFNIRILPLGGKSGTEEISTPEDPMHEYNQKWRDGKTGKTLYKSPKDAIKEIPADNNLAYRGIAWEEWQSIRKTGFIQSKGAYNLGEEQRDYTMFGYEPGTGEHYAHGFAPMQYQTSFKRPSVVISVPRNILLTHQDDPKGIPQNELAYKGKLSASYIQNVWMLVPTQSRTKGGEMELRLPWVAVKEDNTYTGMFKIDPSAAQIGSGNFNIITGYEIRQLQ